MTQYTAKKSYVIDADGSYVVPYVNPADNTNLGVVKPDGATITAAADGTISTNNGNLRAITAYANEGELLTDAQGLADVKSYAHSTFDASKFTVVGSPTITDDGIASGFSTSNYLTKTNAITISDSGEFHIDFEYDISSYTDIQYLLNVYNTNQNEIIIRRGANGNDYACLIFVGGTAIFNKSIGNITDNKIKGFLEYENGVYTFDVNGEQQTVTTNTKLNALTYDISLGVRTSTTPTQPMVNGSIDLKQFSITVDGVEVFSGNKQGVDTIKANNGYTYDTALFAFSDGTHTIYADSDTSPVNLYNADGSKYTGSDWAISGTSVQYNGTPASHTSGSDITLNTLCDASVKISNDGVMTNALNSGIVFNFDTTAKNFRFEYNFIDYDNYPNGYIIGGHNNFSSFGIFSAAWGWELTIKNSSNQNIITTDFNTTNYPTLKVPNKNTKYKAFFELKNGTYTVGIYDGNAWHTDSVASNDTVGHGTINTRQLFNTANNMVSVDLNDIKIFYYGNLAYQPCLKIPYTESKTGSKIVNSIYRDRVNDMADQFGYSPYYTLSDTDFTLPQVELYGLIGKLSNRADYGNSVTTSDVEGSTNAYTFGYKSLAIIKPATPASTYTISVKQAWTDTYKTINGYGYMTLMFNTDDVVYTSASATIDVYKVL